MVEVDVFGNSKFSPRIILSKCFYYYNLKDVKSILRKDLKEMGYEGKFYLRAFTARGKKCCYIRVYQ